MEGRKTGWRTDLTLTEDMLQATIECIEYYYDQTHDGGPTPMWLETMIQQYCAACGVDDFRDQYDFIDAEIRELRKDMKRVAERAAE